MDDSTKDKIQGTTNQVSGSVKEKVGQATDNPDLQDEGTMEKIKGRTQEVVGDIKDKVGDTVDDIKKSFNK